MKKVTDSLFSLKRSYCVFVPQGFVTKCFLIFIIDEVKNFAANIFFKLVSQSRTKSCASLVSHVLRSVQKSGGLLVKKRQRCGFLGFSLSPSRCGSSLGTSYALALRSESNLSRSSSLLSKQTWAWAQSLCNRSEPRSRVTCQRY